MVVALAAGGPTDIVMRIVAAKMTEQLGQQLVIDNRAAAGGSVAPFPGNGDPVGVPPRSTYSDVHAGESNMQVGSAFAGNGDPVSIPTHSTYADRFATEREQHASSTIE